MRSVVVLLLSIAIGLHLCLAAPTLSEKRVTITSSCENQKELVNDAKSTIETMVEQMERLAKDCIFIYQRSLNDKIPSQSEARKIYNWMHAFHTVFAVAANVDFGSFPLTDDPSYQAVLNKAGDWDFIDKKFYQELLERNALEKSFNCAASSASKNNWLSTRVKAKRTVDADELLQSPAAALMKAALQADSCMLPQGNEENSDTVAELSELAQQKGWDIASQSPGNLVLFAIVSYFIQEGYSVDWDASNDKGQKTIRFLWSVKSSPMRTSRRSMRDLVLVRIEPEDLGTGQLG